MTEYLSEDGDLILELESIRPVDKSTQLSRIQIKSTLRTRKTMSDFDATTSRFTLILIIFAMVQIAIALCQLIFDVYISAHVLMGFGIVFMLLFGVGYIFTKLDPDKILKK